MTDDITPATPCSRALFYLRDQVERLKLQDDYHESLNISGTNANVELLPPTPTVPPQDPNAYDKPSYSLILQTPSSNGTLSIVVTPPQIDKKTATEEADDLRGLHENFPPPTLPSQKEPNCRKRTRGDAIQHQLLPPLTSHPPMLPSSLECHASCRSEVNSRNNNNVFGRLLAIHSPIAGIVSTLNVEFMAQFLESGEATVSSPLSLSPHARSVMVMLEHRDSFLAKHSFPVLDDKEGEGQRSTNNEQHGGGSLVSCTPALKMRRQCGREEDYDGFLPLEQPLHF
jgi:hypothetical protein